MRRINPIYQDETLIYFKWTPDGAVFGMSMFDVDRITVHTNIFTGNVSNHYFISDDTFMSQRVKMVRDSRKEYYD